MKRLFVSMLLLGALAFSFQSCEKDECPDVTCNCITDTVYVEHGCIELGLVSTATILNSASGVADDIGEFQIKFDVTAICGTVYLPNGISIPFPNGDNLHHIVTIDRSGELVLNDEIVMSITTNAEETPEGNFKILEGETKRFLIQIEMDNEAVNGGVGVTGSYRASLTRLLFSKEDDNNYTILDADLSKFKTDYLNVD